MNETRFTMKVEGVFCITGRGTVVSGHPGVLPAYGAATVTNPDGQVLETSVTGIERYGIAWSDGQPVGLLLKGLEISQIQVGATVTGMVSEPAVDTLENRIAKALEFMVKYGGIDGEHHKSWVIDQAVRALTGCPMVKCKTKDGYEYEDQGMSDEYRKLIADACLGDDEEVYGWDTGTAP